MGLKRPEMGDGGGNPPMGDGGGEGARMGWRSGMNEVKVEYELQNCTQNQDTCFNLEGTDEGKTRKLKGCGTVKTLVSIDLFLLRPLADDLTIKNDECKAISGANNKKLKDENIKTLEKQLEESKDAPEEYREQMEKTIADYKKSNDRLKTLCTCSEDGCNGGNQVEAKLFLPVITSFIISQIFSS